MAHPLFLDVSSFLVPRVSFPVFNQQRAINVVGLDRDLLFIGLTRPPMLFGVTYGLAITNVIVTAEAFLIFKSFCILLVAIIIHSASFMACLNDSRWFETYLIKVKHCPRNKSYSYWGCNSYRA